VLHASPGGPRLGQPAPPHFTATGRTINKSTRNSCTIPAGQCLSRSASDVQHVTTATLNVTTLHGTSHARWQPRVLEPSCQHTAASRRQHQVNLDAHLRRCACAQFLSRPHTTTRDTDILFALAGGSHMHPVNASVWGSTPRRGFPFLLSSHVRPVPCCNQVTVAGFFAASIPAGVPPCGTRIHARRGLLGSRAVRGCHLGAGPSPPGVCGEQTTHTGQTGTPPPAAPPNYLVL
jgi:hypothetical protein